MNIILKIFSIYFLVLFRKRLRRANIHVYTQYIQHCMDLQLAVDPYKRPVLFESTD